MKSFSTSLVSKAMNISFVSYTNQENVKIMSFPFSEPTSTTQASTLPTEIHIKRSFVQPRPNTIHRNRNNGKRGVVIKEHVSWYHLPENKEAKLTLLNVNKIIGPGETRAKRQDDGFQQLTLTASDNKMSSSTHLKKGNKRIFKKIRKIAHNIMKKIKAKNLRKA